MKQSNPERTTGGPRAMSIVAGITAVAVSVFLASATLAQTEPPTISRDRMQAPIGHRQPRVQDLPPSVARDEGARTSGQKAFDKELQICRAY